MKINVGCGAKLLADYVNVDKFPIDESVVAGDLNDRLPFEDGSVEEILLDNVIEHVPSVDRAMREIYRVLQPGGLAIILTPHYSSQSSWRDPTHLHHLSFFSFEYFTKPRNYIDSSRFEIVSKKLSFGGGLSLFGRIIFKLSPTLYEKSFCFIFPASTIKVVLKKP